MARDNRFTSLARLGFAARGLVYILIGWFALDAALNGGRPIDNQGALGTMAEAPMGRALLALCAIGFAGYAFWRLTEAWRDPERRGRDMKGGFERVGYALSGFTHIGLAILAGRLALRDTPQGRGTPGDASAQGWSAWLLDQPGGVLLLVLVGLGFVAVAAAQAIKAYKARFDELDGDVPAPDSVRWIGRFGYAARSIVFLLVGWFVISAALAHDADQAGGLGEALRQLRAQPQGALLMGVVAAGLTLFGLFSLIEARYRRIRVVRPALMR